MTDTIGTAVSALVAVGVPAVGFLAHRHQAGRARVLDARERRPEAAEELLARRQEDADHQAVPAQASMIGIHVPWTPSTPADGVDAPEPRITDLSSQPVPALSAAIADRPVAGVSGVLAAASVHTFRLPVAPAAALDASPGDLSVAFTDAAGNRWCRDGGGLRQGSRTDTGTWTRGAREAPTVVRAAPSGSPPGPPFGPPPFPRRARALAYPLPAAGLVLLAVVVRVVLFR